MSVPSCISACGHTTGGGPDTDMSLYKTLSSVTGTTPSGIKTDESTGPG